MQENIDEQLKDYIDKLNLVKSEFIRLKKQNLVSIRRDVVKAELQSLLDTCKTYEQLKLSLQTYIDNLLNLEAKNNE